MKASPYAPKRAHVFVCVNRRSPNDPLGSGCAERGEAVYEVLRGELSARGERADVWIARTYCLGLCPKRGAAAAVHPGKVLLTEVMPEDVPELLRRLPKK